MPEQEQPQNRPRSPKHAPDPADSYERDKRHKPRSDAEDNTGMETDPADMNTGQSNAQTPDRQINAQDDPPELGASAQPLNQINLGKSKRKPR